MTLADDLVSLAREYQERNPDLAANAIRNALNFDATHEDARLLASAINPYLWTGFAGMPNSFIWLHEKEMRHATVSAPAYRKLGIQPNDIIVHGSTLYITYGKDDLPTHAVSFDNTGFSPLRQLPRGTRHVVSNWEDNRLIYVREPKPLHAGAPLQFELDSVLFTTENDAETVIGRNTRDGKVTLVGRTQGRFYVDEEIAAHRIGYGENAVFEDFNTGTHHSPILIDQLIDLPEHSRYLRTNRADHPGNLAAVYNTIGRVRRLAVEIPITLCDALRAEADRQTKKRQDEEGLL